jgi:hypothetical protein
MTKEEMVLEFSSIILPMKPYRHHHESATKNEENISSCRLVGFFPVNMVEMVAQDNMM